MPSIRDIFTFYLKAEHLQGRTAIVAIASCEVEEVFNPRIRHNEPRLILRFHGKKLALACNKTQAAALEQITGMDDYSKWIGHTVALSPNRAHNGKDTIAISAPPVAAVSTAQSGTENGALKVPAALTEQPHATTDQSAAADQASVEPDQLPSSQPNKP
jgi:hypothetical protein